MEWKQRARQTMEKGELQLSGIPANGDDGDDSSLSIFNVSIDFTVSVLAFYNRTGSTRLLLRPFGHGLCRSESNRK
jgi:hypothetical protein